MSKVKILKKILLLDRFRSLASGAYKYNPFLINQVRNLDTENGEITDSDIYSLFKSKTLVEMNI